MIPAILIHSSSQKLLDALHYILNFSSVPPSDINVERIHSDTLSGSLSLGKVMGGGVYNWLLLIYLADNTEYQLITFDEQSEQLTGKYPSLCYNICRDLHLLRYLIPSLQFYSIFYIYIYSQLSPCVCQQSVPSDTF